MGLSTLTRLLVLAVLLFAQSASAQLLIGVTRWRPGAQAVAPPSYQGPGDLIPGATAWYGLRAYTLNYAQAHGPLLRLHRLSDDDQCDVNAADTGGFGQTANCPQSGNNGTTADAFCNATTCVVVALYDQTAGNQCSGTCDFQQRIVSSQPTLTFNCFGTNPCIKLVGVQQFTSSGNLALPQPFSLVVAASNSGTAMAEVLTAYGNEVQLGFNAFSTGDIYVTAGTLDHVSGYPTSTMLTIMFVASDPTSVLTVNGGADAVTVGAGNFATQITLGAMTGLFTEGGIWPNRLSVAQQGSLNSNMRTYWGF